MIDSAWPLGAHAPGSYIGRCAGCGEQFMGDKRSRHCLDCAARAANEQIARLKAENGLLRSELVGAWTSVQNERGLTYEMARANAEARYNDMVDTFHVKRAEFAERG